ncbi:MAG: tetraacyldisaccharide 4'-kinase [Flavobacteriales bacterium]
MNKILSILLYPFSLLYGLVTYFRNKLYDIGVFKSYEFRTPVISVGNLNVGGVGKTPHVEYLVRLLYKYNIATLSRGYNRKTKGFFKADDNSTVLDIGDEPLQYKSKFKKIIVVVDENRVRGIKKIKESSPDIDVIILDDAYQHRAVKPGINILVTDYSKLYINDLVLPSGRLREWIIGSNRADIIVVSKTPSILSPIDIRRIKDELHPKPYQEIFFSYTEYGNLIPFTKEAESVSIENEKSSSVLLITGIAKPLPLYYHIRDNYNFVEHLKFPDHHNFDTNDISSIKTSFNNLFGNNKLIITTEKDIMRLSLPEIKNQLNELPIFYLPIEICFHGNGKNEFDDKILKYVRANTTG